MEKRSDGKTVLLVNPSPLLRLGFRHLITIDSEMRVCDEAGSLAQAREKCLALKPDLVVMDPEMDAGGGFSFIQEMRHRQAATRHMVFSGHLDRAAIEHGFMAGALAISTHRDTVESLLKALIDAMAGKRHMTPCVAEDFSSHLGSSPVSDDKGVEDMLSPREFQIFRLLGAGHTIKEAAATAGMSARTVESHVAHIKQKLHLGSNGDLRRRAILHLGGMDVRKPNGDRPI